MKYMLIRKADADTENGVMPSQSLLQAMGEYNERLQQAGVLETGQGLTPSREGCRIEFKDGEAMVTDGPFAETKELIAGYTMLNVRSKEEAIEWARQWPPEDAENGLCLELRRVYEIADFEPGAGLDTHLKLTEKMARLPSGLNIHLEFHGNCREALTFYAEVLGGDLEPFFTHGESPDKSPFPASWNDKILHGSVNLGGRRLMGADMPEGAYSRPQGAMVQLDYLDPERAGDIFNALAEGGQVIMPFDHTFWAYRFGMVTDRFGIGWMINCTEKPE